MLRAYMLRATTPLREVTLVYLVVAALTFGITRLRGVAGAEEYVHLLVAALFLLVAVKLAQRERGGMERYGIDLAGLLAPPEETEGETEEETSEGATTPPADPGPLGIWDLARAVRVALPSALREAGVALGLALIIFPPFVVGFHLWHQPEHPFVLQLPPDLLSFALTQVVVVGLPEEALFRGYFQTRLTDAWPRRRRLFWPEVSIPALLSQAALFAVVHFVVDFSPARLAVFFPGLLFGWLRAWRGGIGAAILLHALSNVFADILVRGWL